MKVLYFLEGIRTPFFDKVFSLLTNLGGESVFIVAAVLVFWCVNKRWGLYILVSGFYCTFISQVIKLMARVPRPWIIDPNFTIVESARSAALDYSFPSGHTISAVAVFGSAAFITRKKLLQVLFASCILITAFSRLYLGVHQPRDVIAGLVIGFAVVCALYPLFRDYSSGTKWIIRLVPLFTLAYIVFIELYSWPADIVQESLVDGTKNSYTLFGCGLGILVAFPLERKYVNFDVNAPLWAQFLKAALGLAFIMGIRVGLKPVLSLFIHNANISSAVRYFFVVLFGLGIWPMTFKWFSAGCPIGKRDA